MKIHSLLPKVAAIAVVVLLLSLALSSIGSVVYERQARRAEAEQSIVQSQAGPQSLLGPVLLSRCSESWEALQGEGKEAHKVTQRREFQLSAVPQRSSVQATAAMEARYRGLFKVNAYATRLNIAAHFAPLAALRPKAEHAGSQLACSPPTLMVAVSDARGIRLAAGQVDGQALQVEAGTLHEAYPRGFHAELPEARRQAETPLDVAMTVELVGTSSFGVAPVAEDSRVQLSADWPHPSFNGRFLPVARQVRGDGFDATWQVSSLASTAALDFAHGMALCTPDAADADAGTAHLQERRGCIESFNVAFIDPVNPYSLSDRALKYGLLFVGLTFVAVGMVELLQGRRVHPVQYLLVGCAISVFFLLLLSLSEHLPFAASYAAAAAACVALLAFYGRHLLGGWRAGALFGAGIAALYGALYALLQLEQTALVLGSVLLFTVLAVVMVLTRRLDWYPPGRRARTRRRPRLNARGRAAATKLQQPRLRKP